MSEFLFDAALLCNWEDTLAERIESSDLKLRPLMRNDYDKGYLELLGQLTTVGTVDKTTFERRFDVMKQTNNSYYVLVLEDEPTGKLAGSATLFIEYKFIHDAGMRGRLEDVVVDKEYRGRHLGKLLVDAVTQLSKQIGCYKISLDCNDKVIDFYKSLGYVSEPGRANTMVIRFGPLMSKV